MTKARKRYLGITLKNDSWSLFKKFPMELGNPVGIPVNKHAYTVETGTPKGNKNLFELSRVT